MSDPFPPHIQAKFRQALALHQNGQLPQAQSLYEEVLRDQPGHADALHLLGVAAFQAGDFARAAQMIGKAIALNPRNATYHSNHGIALKGLGELEAAMASYDRAIALKPDAADAYYSRGNALLELKRPQLALASFDHAVAIKPGHAEAHSNRGNALQGLSQWDAAVASYDRALAINPNLPETHCSRGNALRELRQLEAAVASYDKAIEIHPGYALAYSNRGVTLQELNLRDAALDSLNRAITLDPNLAEAYSNLGNVLREQKRIDQAMLNYQKAIALQPELAEAHFNLGFALQEHKQREAAVTSFERALALKPDYEFLPGILLHAKMQICDWENAGLLLQSIRAGIERNEKVSPSFHVVTSIDSPPVQRLAAQIYVRAKHPANNILGAMPKRTAKDRIHLGYFSADFHDHAVARHTAELFELHDRSKFEVTAFSMGPDTRDAMRHRLRSAFDSFLDVREQSDKEVAILARRTEIDIAIDLSGHTGGSRTSIFAMRVAPVQISYLGYGGTMGADYMDYILADPTLIPEAAQAHFSEKIVYLPNYQVNDTKRRIAEKAFTRKDLGFPAKGFVYCCFNNNYKITPEVFASWMRMLNKVDGSVLFLFAENERSTLNLQNAAGSHGVDASRLIFGKHMPLDEHLARYRATDLFLDTTPCNAGATASDALWAGLPVLTCLGESLVSRVAASLLNAIELPELITQSGKEYEARAVHLATHPQELAQIRDKLARNLRTSPLFDTRRFTRNLEAAYTAIDQRSLAGLPPQNIDVKTTGKI